MQLTPTESKPELRFNFGMVPPIVIMIIGVTATTYSTLDGATRLQGDVQGLGLTLMLICLLALFNGIRSTWSKSKVGFRGGVYISISRLFLLFIYILYGK